MNPTHGYVKLYMITLDQEQFAIIAPSTINVYNVHIGMQPIKKSTCCPTAVRVLCRRSCNSVCSILGKHFRVVRSENSFDIWPNTVQNDYWSPKTAHGTSLKPYPARFLIIVSVIRCMRKRIRQLIILKGF